MIPFSRLFARRKSDRIEHIRSDIDNTCNKVELFTRGLDSKKKFLY